MLGLEKQPYAGAKNGKKKRVGTEGVVGLVFILVPLVGYVIFRGFPLLSSFAALFCDMEGYDISSLTWNNFQNFREIFTDTRFYKSILITLNFVMIIMLS